MPETRAQGPRISYDDGGDGEPAILFLPGWCASRTAFDSITGLCQARRRTLTLDWRGHGLSETPADDFGWRDLVDDAMAVIEASGARQVIPVATSHAGWVAIELRRRLGDRIPKIVLIDWLVLDPPPPFLGALAALQDPATWRAVRDSLFAMWLAGVDNPEAIRFVRKNMGAYDFAMWARAGREIAAAYAEHGNPLRALAALPAPPSVLHLYAQPDDPGYLAAQHAFAAEHPWFRVKKLTSRGHFPTIELPDVVAASIGRFVSDPGPSASPIPEVGAKRTGR